MWSTLRFNLHALKLLHPRRISSRLYSSNTPIVSKRLEIHITKEFMKSQQIKCICAHFGIIEHAFISFKTVERRNTTIYYTKDFSHGFVDFKTVDSAIAAKKKLTEIMGDSSHNKCQFIRHEPIVSQPCPRLSIFGIPFDKKDEEIKAFLSHFGQILFFNVIRFTDSFLPCTFVTVDFIDTQTAVDVRKILHGLALDGSYISCLFSHRIELKPDKNLILFGLKSNTTLSQLEDVVSRVAAYKYIFMVNRDDENSYAFLEFESIEMSTKARKKLHGVSVNDSVIDCRFAHSMPQPNTSLNISGFPDTVDETDVYKYCARFGNLISCEILPPDFYHKKGKVTAVVIFQHLEDAIEARCAILKQSSEGGHLECQYSEFLPTQTLFVFDIPKEATDNEITELFTQFGELSSPPFTKFYRRDKSDGTLLNCAVVKFAKIEDAIKARQTMDYEVIDGRTIRCQFQRPKKKITVPFRRYSSSKQPLFKSRQV